MTIRMQVSPGDDRAALARVACPITVPAVSIQPPCQRAPATLALTKVPRAGTSVRCRRCPDGVD